MNFFSFGITRTWFVSKRGGRAAGKAADHARRSLHVNDQRVRSGAGRPSPAKYAGPPADHFVTAITSGRAIVSIAVRVVLRNLGVDILIKDFVKLEKNAED